MTNLRGREGHESKRGGGYQKRVKRGEGRGNRIIEGVDMIRVHYICIWKCHNEAPYFVQLIHTNKK
jgi:hypothetical protein